MENRKGKIAEAGPAAASTVGKIGEVEPPKSEGLPGQIAEVSQSGQTSDQVLSEQVGKIAEAEASIPELVWVKVGDMVQFPGAWFPKDRDAKFLLVPEGFEYRSLFKKLTEGDGVAMIRHVPSGQHVRFAEETADRRRYVFDVFQKMGDSVAQFKIRTGEVVLSANRPAS